MGRGQVLEIHVGGLALSASKVEPVHTYTVMDSPMTFKNLASLVGWTWIALEKGFATAEEPHISKPHLSLGEFDAIQQLVPARASGPDIARFTARHEASKHEWLDHARRRTWHSLFAPRNDSGKVIVRPRDPRS